MGPLSPNDLGYRGSKYNILVKWETGEQTFEPTKNIAETYNGKLALATYARKNNLLEFPGWKFLKKLAKRGKKLVRLVNQAKLQSFRHTPVYMYGYLVPRNYEQAIEACDDPNDAARKLALYRAGVLSTGLRELDRAERHLNELAGLDFGYRDVAERLDKLNRLRNSG